MNSLHLHLATLLALLLLACTGEAPGSDEPADFADSGMETSRPDSPIEPMDASADARVDAGDADIVDSPLDQGGPEITPIDTPWGELNQSCASLSVNHCEEAFVKGGSYTMGMIGASGANWETMTEEDLRPVTLTDFYIDTHEVTVARFRAFFEAGMPTPPEGLVIAPGILWEDRFNQYIDEPGWERYPDLSPFDEPAVPHYAFERRCPNRGHGYYCKCTWAYANDQVDDDDPFAPAPPDDPNYFENKALNCINWYTAAAFCAWDGKRLPTEAEWEFVGRNRGQNIEYPWGDTLPTCEQANVGPTGRCAEQPRYWPEDVASHLSGDTSHPAGVHDMVGGVAEWMADVYQSYRNDPGCWSEGAYGIDPLCSWEKDPPLWKPPAFHTLRGADWRNAQFWNSERFAMESHYSRHWAGFRCARKE